LDERGGVSEFSGYGRGCGKEQGDEALYRDCVGDGPLEALLEALAYGFEDADEGHWFSLLISVDLARACGCSSGVEMRGFLAALGMTLLLL